MLRTNHRARFAGLALAAFALMSLFACSDHVVQNQDSSSPVLILHRPALGTLTVDDVLEDSTEATNEGGGQIDVGDEAIGNSALSVPADAVDDIVKIKMLKMKVNKIGQVTAELRPDGTHFKRPVMLVLSYKGADLGGIDETSLAIFCLNEVTGVWELVPGSVPDPEGDKVSAPLWHFSYYAIGSDE